MLRIGAMLVADLGVRLHTGNRATKSFKLLRIGNVSYEDFRFEKWTGTRAILSRRSWTTHGVWNAQINPGQNEIRNSNRSALRNICLVCQFRQSGGRRARRAACRRDSNLLHETSGSSVELCRSRRPAIGNHRNVPKGYAL